MSFPFRLVVLCALCVLFGVGNNVSFFLMAKKAARFPLFLLYVTTFMYTTMYGVWAFLNIIFDKERHQPALQAFIARDHQLQFFWLGIWLTVNGLLSQFSDPYVNGNLQSVLYQLQLPATGILAVWLLKERFSFLSLLGSALVLGGCLLVALPPLLSGSNSTEPNPIQFNSTLAPTIGPAQCVGQKTSSSTTNPFWAIVFALSVIPNGINAIIQEQLFHKNPRLDSVLLLFWSNLFTLAFYVLALPLGMAPNLGDLSWHGLLLNQKDAFLCFYGGNHLPCGCEKNAFIPIIAFVACYMGFFYFLAVLVKEVSAVFETLINGVVTPAAAVAFSFHWLLGSDAEALTPWVIAACFIVPVGVVVFKFQEIRSLVSGRELVPLLSVDGNSLNCTPTATPSATPLLGPRKGIGARPGTS
eukprot:m.194143 g.194143  ORF g.194143 m.194143 type:complete len:414 (-) comp25790_c0_seq4:57-1298(-)